MSDWYFNQPPGYEAQIEYVDGFDARGMQRVYGRGDHFPTKAAFNLDIWRDRSGRLFARCWSRSAEVTDRSFIIHGIPMKAVTEREEDAAFSDDWIPKIVRDEYDEWISGEW